MDAAEKVKRLEEKKARTRRRHAVGDLAERAGLFAWDNGTLAELFALLARLTPCPNPVAVLEGVLCHAPADLAEISLTAPTEIPSEIGTGPEGENSELPFSSVSGSLSVSEADITH